MESASVSGREWANRIARVLFLLFAIPVVWLSSFFGMLHSVMFLAFQPLVHSSTPGDLVEIGPPVKGEWYVFHGGRGSLFNHHYPHFQVQSHANLWDGASRTFPIRFKGGVGYLRRNDRADFGD